MDINEQQLVADSLGTIQSTLRDLKRQAEQTIEVGEEIINKYDQTDFSSLDFDIKSIEKKVAKNKVLFEILEERIMDIYREESNIRDSIRDNE